MRFSALVPILLGLGALAMTLLCLFAGSTTSFLPEFSLITVNTSQIGQGILNSSYVDSHPELAAILDMIPPSLQDDAEDYLNAVLKKLGVHDFYSGYLMGYCNGYYEPKAVPDETVSRSDITHNFTYCSRPSAKFQLDPREALQRDLNASGNGWLDVSDLKWPEEIDRGIDAIHIVQRVAFIIYCVSIALIGLAALRSILSLVLSGRICGNIFFAVLAFLVVAVSSSLATAIAVIGTRAVDRYAEQVGVTADPGRRFLGLTWGATATMLVCVVWWCVDWCVGRRRRNTRFSPGDRDNSWGK